MIAFGLAGKSGLSVSRGVPGCKDVMNFIGASANKRENSDTALVLDKDDGG